MPLILHMYIYIYVFDTSDGAVVKSVMVWTCRNVQVCECVAICS